MCDLPQGGGRAHTSVVFFPGAKCALKRRALKRSAPMGTYTYTLKHTNTITYERLDRGPHPPEFRERGPFLVAKPLPVLSCDAAPVPDSVELGFPLEKSPHTRLLSFVLLSRGTQGDNSQGGRGACGEGQMKAAFEDIPLACPEAFGERRPRVFRRSRFFFRRGVGAP